jgi:hypothetical protein
MSKDKKERNLKNLRFAVELEVEFPNKVDSQKLINKHRIIRGWEITWDGTLDNGAEYKAKDRNKLYWNEDSIDQIREIIGLIKAHRGNIKSSTCGLHVHIDMKNFTPKEIRNIVVAFIKKQNSLYKRFKVFKCRETYAQKIPIKYLKYITENNIKKVKENGSLDIGCDYFNDRHYSLNILSLDKHNSLEFRLFNGTIQINKIKQAIKFALEFCLKNAKR